MVSHLTVGEATMRVRVYSQTARCFVCFVSFLCVCVRGLSPKKQLLLFFLKILSVVYTYRCPSHLLIFDFYGFTSSSQIQQRGTELFDGTLSNKALHQTGMHPFATDEYLHRYCYGETMFDHSCGFRVDKLQLPTLRKNADVPSVESISV